jgi:microcystin-dependent protein
MACKDCFNNCEELFYDACGKYTGDDIPALGICNGDSLLEIHEVILSKLLTALDGTGIVLSDVTLENCPHLLTLFGTKDKSLTNLFQLLIDNNCTLKQLIDNLTPSPFAFNTACLSGLPTSPTRDDILNSALNLLCSIKTTVDTFPSTYVKLSDLTNLVEQILQNNQELPTTIQYASRMVPNVAVPYFGTLTNFDNTGKGVNTLGWDKVYICNGLNGTPDMRGRTVVGAVRNVPGGTLDSAVSPSSPLNIQPVDYATGDKFGENFHKLTASEIPAHSHQVTDPGHKHNLPSGIQIDGTVGGGEGGTNEKGPNTSLQTATSSTGITIGTTGGDQPHNVRQPSIAGIWIMYIP